MKRRYVMKNVILLIGCAAALAAQSVAPPAPPAPPVPPEPPAAPASPPFEFSFAMPPIPPMAPMAPHMFSFAPQIKARSDRDQARDHARREERAYRDGTRNLDRGEWEKAAANFTEAIEVKGSRLDGAFYWKAYALGKLGRRDEAAALIGELEKTNPKSRWLEDAKALRVELRQAAGQPVSADIQNDEELKLIALNGLVDSAPDRAIPALRELLRKSTSPRLKERALFVLAQSGTPQGREILTQYAKGAGNPDLQLKAVEYLGRERSRENLALLAEIYSSNSDTAVRQRVLRAYLSAREKERLFEAARGEADPELRREAIMFLGALRAEAELQQLYAAENKPELRRHILHGLREAQSVKGLIEAARKETDPELKREAVQMLSGMRTKEATDFLMELINK